VFVLLLSSTPDFLTFFLCYNYLFASYLRATAPSRESDIFTLYLWFLYVICLVHADSLLQPHPFFFPLFLFLRTPLPFLYPALSSLNSLGPSNATGCCAAVGIPFSLFLLVLFLPESLQSKKNVSPPRPPFVYQRFSPLPCVHKRRVFFCFFSPFGFIFHFDDMQFFFFLSEHLFDDCILYFLLRCVLFPPTVWVLFSSLSVFVGFLLLRLDGISLFAFGPALSHSPLAVSLICPSPGNSPDARGLFLPFSYTIGLLPATHSLKVFLVCCELSCFLFFPCWTPHHVYYFLPPFFFFS